MHARKVTLVPKQCTLTRRVPVRLNSGAERVKDPMRKSKVVQNHLKVPNLKFEDNPMHGLGNFSATHTQKSRIGTSNTFFAWECEVIFE